MVLCRLATICRSFQDETAQQQMPFAVLRLEPWRLRVFPGSVLLGQGSTVLT